MHLDRYLDRQTERQTDVTATKKEAMNLGGQGHEKSWREE